MRACRLSSVLLEDLGARQLNRGPTCDPIARVSSEARQIDGLARGWQHLKAKAMPTQLNPAILHQLQGNGGTVMWLINAAVSSGI
jgi:hypothetical protein